MPRLQLTVPPPSAIEGKQPLRSELHELWFAIGRREWSSLVLVPADPATSAQEIATALAEVGVRVSATPVTAVTTESLDYEFVRALVELQASHAREDHGGPVKDVSSHPLEPLGGTSAAHPDPQRRPMNGKVIVALPSVIREPLGLGIAHSADVVVLCIEMGVSRLEHVRRTIELVGRDRIAGCFVSRRRKP